MALTKTVSRRLRTYNTPDHSINARGDTKWQCLSLRFLLSKSCSAARSLQTTPRFVEPCCSFVEGRSFYVSMRGIWHRRNPPGRQAQDSFPEGIQPNHTRTMNEGWEHARLQLGFSREAQKKLPAYPRAREQSFFSFQARLIDQAAVYFQVPGTDVMLLLNPPEVY